MVKATPLSRNVDSKGRLTLGEAYANRTVLVEERADGEIVIRLARVIPEREAWLYENADALASVRRGIAEARAKRFISEPPDLTSSAKLASELGGE